MAENNCTFCHSIHTEKCFKTTDIYQVEYQIRKCNDCNAFFLFPKPNDTELQKYYDGSYYGESISKFSKSVEKYIDVFRKRRAKRILKYLPSKGSALDIGCGNGRFLNYLSKFGDFDLCGTELQGNSANRATQYNQINLKVGMLEKDDFQRNKFDVITMFHVFEHLSEPKKMLEIVTDIIKENGVLIISMPDIGSWQSRLFKGKWYHLDPPRHLVFFEREALKNIIKKFGFVCIEEKSISFEQNPYGWVQSILNSMLKRREVLYERLKGNKTFAHEYSPFSIILQKCFMILMLPFFFLQEIVESLFRKSATFSMTFRKISGFEKS